MPEFPLIPNYRIEKLLGKGGMADVYLGVQENLNRPVAVKVLAPELLRDENFARSFIKEAQTAAKLSHPGIMHVYDVGQTNGAPYIVMEYLAGGSLKEAIQRGMNPREALQVLHQMADALHYAHEQGYVHRDIKPDNILFRKPGEAVLTDFGIARAVGSTTKLTKTGMSIGTPHYMSPEQARGKTLDGRSDLYSLGIVFHEMLTGRVPYEAEDSIAIAVKHIQEPIPTLPPQHSVFQGLLNKLLAKEPEERIQKGKELAVLLSGVIGGGSIQQKEKTDFNMSADYASKVEENLREKFSRGCSESSRISLNGVAEQENKNLFPPINQSTRLVEQVNERKIEKKRRKKLVWIGLVNIILIFALIIIWAIDSAGKKDLAAWNRAKADNKIWSYQAYLSAYPDGKFKKEASSQKYRLESEERRKEEERKKTAERERMVLEGKMFKAVGKSWKLLRKDSFSGTSNGWWIGKENDAFGVRRISIRNSSLNIKIEKILKGLFYRIHCPGDSAGADIYLSVDVRVLYGDASVGIYFRNNSDSFYGFLIQGNYFYVSQLEDGKWKTIHPKKRSEAIQSGGNEIALLAQGEEIIFLINGVLVEKMKDNQPKGKWGKKSGLCFETNNNMISEVEYDNFELRVPR